MLHLCFEDKSYLTSSERKGRHAQRHGADWIFENVLSFFKPSQDIWVYSSNQ
jgi:hypothetical protein